VQKFSREQVTGIVEKLLAPGLAEDEQDLLADELDEGTRYPGGASLLVLFWQNYFAGHETPPVDQIVERIVSHRPIILPAGTRN
jgi:hypothetical protein